MMAKHNLMNTWVRRKVMHVGTGPLFILMWPQFSASGSVFASMVPLAMTLKFALIGLGLLNDEDAVNSMARSGKKEELLRGPLAYGVVFVLSTAMMWKQYRSVIALFALCFGDGAAEAFGRRFGRTVPLPWNKHKSLAGSAGFVFTATLCTYVFTMYLVQQQQRQLSFTSLWQMTAPVIPRLLAVHTTGTYFFVHLSDTYSLSSLKHLFRSYRTYLPFIYLTHPSLYCNRVCLQLLWLNPSLANI